jgi:hypothetical protein
MPVVETASDYGKISGQLGRHEHLLIVAHADAV